MSTTKRGAVNKADERSRIATSHLHPRSAGGDWKGGQVRGGKPTMDADGAAARWRDPQGSNFHDYNPIPLNPLADQHEPTDAQPINLHKRQGGCE